MAKCQFDIHDYVGMDVAMICKDEFEAKMFTQYLDSIGRRWCSGASYLSDTCYPKGYNSTIAYFFTEGTYSISNDMNRIIAEGKALYYGDFEWNDEENEEIDTKDLDDFLNLFGCKPL